MLKIPWVLCGLFLILLLNVSQFGLFPATAQSSLESRLNRLETTINGLQIQINSLESRVNQRPPSLRTSPPRIARNSSPATPQMFENLANLVVEINQRLKRLEQKVSQLEKR